MSHSIGSVTLGITRASLGEISDEMREVRRQYRVERGTGRVVHKQTGRVIGWASSVPRPYSCKYEDGRDLCDEFSVTHAVCTLHANDSPAVPRD